MTNSERYAGHVYPESMLRPPEEYIPSLQHVYFVLGTVMSDIGKGWLSASVAATLDDPLIIKIDPMLNQQFPSNVGIPMGDTHVSDDFRTYRSLGLDPKVEHNILMGAIWRSYLDESVHPPLITEGSIKKQTHADVADYFSDQLITITRQSHAKNVVIEIGGNPTDNEHDILPATLRLFGIKTTVIPELVLLSYFEIREGNVTDGKKGLKTQIIRQGIRDSMTRYAGLPMKGIFVRRRFVSETIPSTDLTDELYRAAYETQVDPSKIHLLENFDDVSTLQHHIAESAIFSEQDRSVFVSACMLGIPCRYNGISYPVSDRKMNVIVQNGTALILCPEVLAGLPTPRGPYTIDNGNGDDVLNGTARVLDQDGMDVSSDFIQGAIRTLRICLQHGVRKAFLRDGSPSCGVQRITTSAQEEISDIGVTTALLERWGIECVASDTM